MTSSTFALFIWVNDDPITGNILKLSNITAPRKDFAGYSEGEKVTAKCPGYGNQEAVVGKIGDETPQSKDVLSGILAGEGFNKLLTSLGLLMHEPVISQPKNDAKIVTKKRPGVQILNPEVDESDSEDSISILLPKRLKTVKETYRPSLKKRKTCEDTFASLDEEDSTNGESDEPWLAATSTPVTQKKRKVVDEGMKAKLEKNKEKRSILKTREKSMSDNSLVILQPEEKECNDLKHVTEELRSMKGKVDLILVLLEKFLDCRTCLRKAYKMHVLLIYYFTNAWHHAMIVILNLFPVPDFQSVILSNDETMKVCGEKKENKETKVTSENREKKECKTSENMDKRESNETTENMDKRESNETTENMDKRESKETTENKNKNKKEDIRYDKEELTDTETDNNGLMHDYDSDVANSYDSGSEKEKVMTYVGNYKYDIRMEKSMYTRIIQASKTPEKLALNLVVPLLSQYEIKNCTVYGNEQYKKEAIKENKRRAIRCAVFDQYGKDLSKEQKEQLWNKIVIKINDKIRGIRNNKYDKQMKKQ